MQKKLASGGNKKLREDTEGFIQRYKEKIDCYGILLKNWTEFSERMEFLGLSKKFEPLHSAEKLNKSIKSLEKDYKKIYFTQEQIESSKSKVRKEFGDSLIYLEEKIHNTLENIRTGLKEPEAQQKVNQLIKELFNDVIQQNFKKGQCLDLDEKLRQIQEKITTFKTKVFEVIFKNIIQYIHPQLSRILIDNLQALKELTKLLQKHEYHFDLLYKTALQKKQNVFIATKYISFFSEGNASIPPNFTATGSRRVFNEGLSFQNHIDSIRALLKDVFDINEQNENDVNNKLIDTYLFQYYRIIMNPKFMAREQKPVAKNNKYLLNELQEQLEILNHEIIMQYLCQKKPELIKWYIRFNLERLVSYTRQKLKQFEDYYNNYKKSNSSPAKNSHNGLIKQYYELLKSLEASNFTEMVEQLPGFIECIETELGKSNGLQQEKFLHSIFETILNRAELLKNFIDRNSEQLKEEDNSLSLTQASPFQFDELLKECKEILKDPKKLKGLLLFVKLYYQDFESEILSDKELKKVKRIPDLIKPGQTRLIQGTSYNAGYNVQIMPSLTRNGYNLNLMSKKPSEELLNKTKGVENKEVKEVFVYPEGENWFVCSDANTTPRKIDNVGLEKAIKRATKNKVLEGTKYKIDETDISSLKMELSKDSAYRKHTPLLCLKDLQWGDNKNLAIIKINEDGFVIVDRRDVIVDRCDINGKDSKYFVYKAGSLPEGYSIISGEDYENKSVVHLGNLPNRYNERIVESYSYKVNGRKNDDATKKALTLFANYTNSGNLCLSKNWCNKNLHIYGDIHGDFDSLCKSIEQVLSKDLDAKFIFSGDYIDRGIYNLEVLIFLFLLLTKHPENVVILPGNHELFEFAESKGREFYDQLKFKQNTVDLFEKNVQIPTFDCVQNSADDVREEIIQTFVDIFRLFPTAAIFLDANNKNRVCEVTHGGMLLLEATPNAFFSNSKRRMVHCEYNSQPNKEGKANVARTYFDDDRDVIFWGEKTLENLQKLGVNVIATGHVHKNEHKKVELPDYHQISRVVINSNTVTQPRIKWEDISFDPQQESKDNVQSEKRVKIIEKSDECFQINYNDDYEERVFIIGEITDEKLVKLPKFYTNLSLPDSCNEELINDKLGKLEGEKVSEGIKRALTPFLEHIYTGYYATYQPQQSELIQLTKIEPSSSSVFYNSLPAFKEVVASNKWKSSYENKMRLLEAHLKEAKKPEQKCLIIVSVLFECLSNYVKPIKMLELFAEQDPSNRENYVNVMNMLKKHQFFNDSIFNNTKLIMELFLQLFEKYLQPGTNKKKVFKILFQELKQKAYKQIDNYYEASREKNLARYCNTLQRNKQKLAAIDAVVGKVKKPFLKGLQNLSQEITPCIVVVKDGLDDIDNGGGNNFQDKLQSYVKWLKGDSCKKQIVIIKNGGEYVIIDHRESFPIVYVIGELSDDISQIESRVIEGDIEEVAISTDDLDKFISENSKSEPVVDNTSTNELTKNEHLRKGFQLFLNYIKQHPTKQEQLTKIANLSKEIESSLQLNESEKRLFPFSEIENKIKNPHMLEVDGKTCYYPQAHEVDWSNCGEAIFDTAVEKIKNGLKNSINEKQTLCDVYHDTTAQNLKDLSDNILQEIIGAADLNLSDNCAKKREIPLKAKQLGGSGIFRRNGERVEGVPTTATYTNSY